MSRRVYTIIGIVITLLATYYFITFALRTIPTLPPIELDYQIALAVVGGFILYLVVLLLGAVAWHLLIRGCGETPVFGESWVVFSLSQFAKYIPGNIAQHVGRFTLSKEYRLGTVSTLLAMGIEIAWIVSGSIVLALLSISMADIRGGNPPISLFPVSQVVLLIALAFALPLVAKWVIEVWRPEFLQRYLGSDLVVVPSLSRLITTWLIYVNNFIMTGLIAYLLSWGFFGDTVISVWSYVGIFSVAWVAGFLTPGAPAGLGVRDAILLAGFSSSLGEPAALVIVVAHRIIATVGDGIAFLLGLIGRRIWPAEEKIAKDPEDNLLLQE